MAGVAAVLLAAGASVRFGSPKQLIRLGGETLLDRAIRAAVEAELDPIYGVVSADLPLEAASHRMIPVINHDAMEGMASSIRCGVRAVKKADLFLAGIIILACDQPSVTVQHLRQLARGGQDLLASAYAGRKGIPAYFPVGMFGELLTLRGDMGARELLKSANALNLPGGELDIDTIEDLERARKLYERDTGTGSGSLAPKHP
jgi:molybdenum cofactor cytidylyltransferase